MISRPPQLPRPEVLSSPLIFLGIVALGLGMLLKLHWLVAIATFGLAALGVIVLARPLLRWLVRQITAEDAAMGLAVFGLLAAGVGWLYLSGFWQAAYRFYHDPNWEAVGALGEGVIGAIGQVLIALLALFIAWRQYVIERRLTVQQNIITQQQTIDAYFQGISDLVIDDQGLLEDWPQERAIAEGRTAALLSSIDAVGKAKVLRFLSHACLLTPLKRDVRLGRAILDGEGGYAEDRVHGIRVINLGATLVGQRLNDTDLRETDLSNIDLSGADLSDTDLLKSNLAGTSLWRASLRGANLDQTRLFYGDPDLASPNLPGEATHYSTGVGTGAIVEDTDFSGVTGLSPEQRHYCCAWCGSRARRTIPGGCEGISNQLGR